MNAVIVCVEMADLLALTLPRNRQHFGCVAVVTTPADYDTQKVALSHDAQVFCTNVFYEGGGPTNERSYFRKWDALEQGLGFLGRTGWLTILDADTIWPQQARSWLNSNGQIGVLYSPKRRLLTDMSRLMTDGVPKEEQWGRFPLHPGSEFAGYSQTFHADDPVLVLRPWFDSYISAGTGDSFFQARWRPENKVRPPWEALHLGPCGQNWCGRVTPMLDGRAIKEAPKRNAQLQKILAARLPPDLCFRHEMINWNGFSPSCLVKPLEPVHRQNSRTRSRHS